MAEVDVLAIAKEIWGDRFGVGDGTAAPVAVVIDYATVDLTWQMHAFAARILDEAAKVCEEKYANPGWNSDLRNASLCCAADIRVLAQRAAG